MPKFIEVHDNLINIDDVSRVEFLSDDIYLGLFPKDEEGELFIDYVSFTYAKIYTFDGQTFEMSIDLYQPEDGENEESWSKRNQGYVGQSMATLYDALGDITRVTGFEYRD